VTGSLSADARRVLAAQALRAFGYGLAAVLLGVTLEERGLEPREVGVVLACVLAGSVFVSILLARYGDRVGRRRCYLTLYGLLALSGVVFAFSASAWLLAIVALSGSLSTDVVESGPFTTLEQAMLAGEIEGRELVRGFGVYNAVASAAGSLGALAAGGPALLHATGASQLADDRIFLVLVPIALAGALIANTLSPHVEAVTYSPRGRTLGESRPAVRRLAALFAIDAFGGGFVVQSFIAYWLTSRFDASLATVGLVFAAMGVLQTASFLVAARVARRFGLLNTMVFTHLPSNLLLACVPLAPTLWMAVVLLLARTALSQMDVPTRQAYVMALVTPEERTAAAAYTNTARYVARPLGPLLAGSVLAVGTGLPFVLAGSIKATYDLVLWRWFRSVALPAPAQLEPEAA
jgi:MFS family permease